MSSALKCVSFESDKKINKKKINFFSPANAISVTCERPIDCLEHLVNINSMFGGK